MACMFETGFIFLNTQFMEAIMSRNQVRGFLQMTRINRHAAILSAVAGMIAVQGLATTSQAAGSDVWRKCEKGSYNVAIRYCGIIVRDRSESRRNRAIAYTNMGIARYHAGQIRRSLQDYSNAIILNRNYADAYTGRGWSYQVLGQYDNAIADFDEAIRIAPGDLLAYNNRGVAYEKKGMLERALADFRHVLNARGKRGDTDDRDAKRYARNNMRRVQGKLAQQGNRRDEQRFSQTNPPVGFGTDDPEFRKNNRETGPDPEDNQRARKATDEEWRK